MIGDVVYVPHKGWSGEIIGITELFTPSGGRMLTVAGPNKTLALINELYPNQMISDDV